MIYGRLKQSKVHFIHKQLVTPIAKELITSPSPSPKLGTPPQAHHPTFTDQHASRKTSLSKRQMIFKPSKYILISDQGYDEAEQTAFNIVFSTRTLELFWLSSGYVNMLLSGNFANLPEDVIKELLFAEILVPDTELELEVIIRRSQAMVADDKLLSYQIGTSTADIENIIPNIEQLLQTKNHRKLLIKWQDGGISSHKNPLPGHTHKLKALAKKYACTYEAELTTSYIEDHLTDLPAYKNEYNIIKANFEINVAADTALTNTIAAICNRLITADSTPAINLVFKTGHDAFNIICACIDTIKQHGMHDRIACALVRGQANSTKQDIAMPAKVFAKMDMNLIEYMVAQGFKPGLLPTHKPIIFAPAETTNHILASACANCNLLPVCGGAPAALWENGNIPCPTDLYNAGKKLSLHYATSN